VDSLFIAFRILITKQKQRKRKSWTNKQT